VPDDRDSRLLGLLASCPAAVVEQVTWARGTMPLRVSAHVTDRRPPDNLITSVRCIVFVGSKVVVCRDPDQLHVIPGGRREAGESLAQTAVREVHEETGWHLDPGALTQLGFLHLQHLAPKPDGYAYPYPDFTQLVFTGRTVGRAVDVEAEWSDTDGYVVGCQLMDPAEALALDLEATQIALLRAALVSPA
jgi:8-oxo-dGTP pyrophosphatase MutT (NUDIX family)